MPSNLYMPAPHSPLARVILGETFSFSEPVRPDAQPPVTGVHFLVHPLFHADPTSMNEENMRAYDRYLEETAHLSQGYQEKAMRLSPGELMFVFLHFESTEFREFPNRYKRLITELLGELNLLLGIRLFVNSWDTEGLDEIEVAHETADEARRRGFLLTQEIDSFAYGEALTECVNDAAYTLHEGFNLARPTQVLLRLTEWAIPDPHLPLTPDLIDRLRGGMKPGLTLNEKDT